MLISILKFLYSELITHFFNKTSINKHFSGPVFLLTDPHSWETGLEGHTPAYPWGSGRRGQGEGQESPSFVSLQRQCICTIRS